MHGIERVRGSKGPGKEDGGVKQIVVRYSDGRTLSFTPDAGRELFSEDDVQLLQKVLIKASARAEWGDLAARAEG